MSSAQSKPHDPRLSSPPADSLLHHIPAPHFDLASTIASGQAFHWRRHGPGYIGAIHDIPAYLEQRGDLIVTTADPSLVTHYLALDHPLPEIYSTFPTDSAMAAALHFCRGMRILRQPYWECLGTFITSSMKQVPHIAQISHTLRLRYGVELEPPFPGGPRPFAYPLPAALAGLSERDLRACALGYRARNLLATARLVAERGINLDAVAAMPDDEARSALCQCPGVGEKVANCVLLFAYERLRAFPIDVWIARILREQYLPRARKITASRLRDFARRHFGPYGGYAQQYLFHHARSTVPRVRKKSPLKKNPLPRRTA